MVPYNCGTIARPYKELDLGVVKRINEQNLNRIVNELGQNFIDSNSINLLNKLKSQDLDSIRLLNEYSVCFV